MKKWCIFVLILTGIIPVSVLAQTINIYYGSTGMTAYIGEDLWVPITAYINQHLSIGYIHAPMATNNLYIDSRLGGERMTPLADWDDVTFLTPIANTPSGYTSQSLVAWEALGSLSCYDPYNGESFARFKVHVLYDQNLVGNTYSNVFTAGSHPLNGNTQFGNCSGQIEYNNFNYTSRSVTFLAPYLIGTGLGVMDNAQNHIDTRGHTVSSYRMEDVTRRGTYNPHSHNGLMGIDQSIKTYTYNSSYPGAIMVDNDNVWNAANQKAAVDAHVYAGLFYDYLLSSPFGRNSFDNLGTGLISTVQSTESSDNAWFNPSNNTVVFCTPGVDRRSFAGCIEAVTHEWAHGITFSSSNLPYERESGALHEAISNMMGVTTKWNYSGRPGNVDWSLCSNTHTSGLPVFRMDEPHSTPNLPCEFHRPDFYQDAQDWIDPVNCVPSENTDFCGVHTNSGVPEKMFQLLSSGGTSTHNNVVVQAIGIENAMRIIMRANIFYWNSNTTTFMRARRGVIEAARLDYSNRGWAIQAANAWNAVGVCDNSQYVPGDANNNGVATGYDVIYMNNVLKGISPPLNTCTLDYGVDPQIWQNFYAAADYNGDCAFNGIDISYAVAYYKGQQPAILWCPHYTPGNP